MGRRSSRRTTRARTTTDIDGGVDQDVRHDLEEFLL